MNSDDNSVSELAGGKTIAIVSYLTIIGLVVALVMNMEKKDKFAAFHIRQMLGLGLLSVASWMVSVIPLLIVITLPFNLFLMALWVMGLISAINGEVKPIPVLGRYFQDWFAGLFAA